LSSVSSQRKHLVVVRSGPSSLHGSIIERLSEQNYDFALSWFSDQEPGPLAAGARFVHRVKGPKWPGLYATLTEYRDVVDEYDYVWLPDDDLQCVPESVSEMFETTAALGAWLAQPALTPDSYFSHAFTLQHPGFQARFTNFVEVMAPVIARDFLPQMLRLMSESVTGWGIDDLASRLVPIGKMVVVDSTPVFHTRPLGGANYDAARASGVSNPHVEMQELLTRHRYVKPAPASVTLGGITSAGDVVSFGASEADLLYLLRTVVGDFLTTTGYQTAVTDFASTEEEIMRDPDVSANLSSRAQNNRRMVHYIYSVDGLANGNIHFPFALWEIPDLIAAALTDAGITGTKLHTWIEERDRKPALQL